MKKITLLLALLILPLSTWAQSISTSFTTKSNGVLRFALVGKDFTDYRGQCDSDSFSVRVLDQAAGTSDYYTAASGSQNWAITKACGFNQEFSHSLLKPGVVLQVETFMGRQLQNRMWLSVPCYNSIQELQVRTFNFSLTEITTGISCAGGAYRKETGQVTVATPSQPTVVVVTPAPTPTTNACDVGTVVGNGIVHVNAVCDRTESAIVSVSSGNRVLCRNNNAILGNYSSGRQTICSIPRNNAASMNIRVDIQTLSFSDSYNQMIAKNPTFGFAPEGKILTPVNLTVGKSSKALSRGNYWSPVISAQVFDRDVDNNSTAIRAELIEVTATGERILETESAENGGTVTFKLLHQYITPWFFGSDRHEGALKVGHNTLKIRVYDAYEAGRFTDLAPMTVYLEP